MSRRNLDETVKSGLEAIYRQAQRASNLIQNLLLFGQRHRPDKCLVNINQLLERALDTCAHVLETNDVQVSEDLDPDLPPTLADPDQMQQVFVNIIDNAEYAMAEAHGRGKLHIQSETREGAIRVTLTDDGPGIPDEDLPHIFDPFFTSRGNGKGTGLGLTVCYGLVEAHGGSIDARSKVGEGTSVEVEIPIVTSESEPAGELNLDRLEL
jgi:two-component system NtrC family sensor kinase